MEAGRLCHARYDRQHVTDLTRSNEKLGIASVMYNIHGISIVSETDGNVAGHQ